MSQEEEVDLEELVSKSNHTSKVLAVICNYYYYHNKKYYY